MMLLVSTKAVNIARRISIEQLIIDFFSYTSLNRKDICFILPISISN